MALRPWHFVVAMVAGWLNREQSAAIEYLREENRVLREQLGKRRFRLTDAQRRRRAIKGKVVGTRGVRELGCIVAPETLLRWYRQLVARKYDGSQARGLGRPRKPEAIRKLVLDLASENRTWGYTCIRDVQDSAVVLSCRRAMRTRQVRSSVENVSAVCCASINARLLSCLDRLSGQHAVLPVSAPEMPLICLILRPQDRNRSINGEPQA